MKIARVVVDVPAMQTDRPFDYLIPDQWKDVIVPGIRVIVPFGPRKVQGFVIEVTSASEVSKLKKISELFDLTPALTDELLELGKWLTEKTLCFQISAFQAMLPAAMKAKYEKRICLTRSSGEMSPELAALFENNQDLSWKDAEAHNLFAALQKEIKKGTLEVVYQVSQKGKQKKVRYLTPAADFETLKRTAEEMPAQAGRQKAVLDYIIASQKSEISISDLKARVNASDSSIKSLVQKGILAEKWMEIYRDPFEHRTFKQTKNMALTNEQQTAIAPILDSIEAGRHEVFMMYGVTGSGKTEVYLQAIDRVMKEGKEAIVLVPEISLTPQMVDRFKGRFGSKVAVLHSGLSTGEKYDEWRKIQRKEVQLAVGARSAIFAPFENLGIIVIDEEHESSYKQEENPKYHARDVAIRRAESYRCPVVLGSATPSLESFARAIKGVYHLLPLRERVNSRALPEVNIVDMREELRKGNRSMFSSDLFEQLQLRLDRKEQTVLFLNRRGFSAFVMCRDCGYVIQCPNCDISMTYHRQGNKLKCHYCAHEAPMPSVCPECSSEHIRFFGTGTQKVEEELAKVLPEARVIRMDVDTTSRKGAHERLLGQFGDGKADILLGTQMIAKGLDFPNVTLVGVLAADTMLHLPDFRAAEKTFQLLTQVSGRAGRHELSGEVVIQSYTPDHYSIQLAKDHHFDGFYEREMMERKQHAYPPFYYLAVVNVSHPDLLKTSSVMENIAQFLIQNLDPHTKVLGPVASPIPRIKNRYRYQCMIKYKRDEKLIPLLKKVMDRYQQEMARDELAISIDLNPTTLM
ncbi:primosomal protein N' [Metabacillus sp. KIGAM252]|uniref:Replication restart protein PriA n=1 Tax=Metabacillus flavus TaxID=2823519 RepID=A0ABS5LE92_9BACI|nr:primosomal protein N' [Metabacillus flavus]MBS2968931.1 primosomal protein N' [Metabacillus flavus]